jgi:tryptophanyl-tRNA synthetase
LHLLYSNPDEIAEIRAACPQAGMGCVDCKKILIKTLVAGLAPVREKQQWYREHPDTVSEIIENGRERAASVTAATMDEVRRAVKLR